MIETTVLIVIEKYSNENGYDGLFNDTFGCACFNGDLLTCGSDSNGNCIFGHKVICPHCKVSCICISKDTMNFKCPNCEENFNE